MGPADERATSVGAFGCGELIERTAYPRLKRTLRPLRSSTSVRATPGRGQLRVSDACEFRHRELLEYLASEPNLTDPWIVVGRYLKIFA
jgi:hypothetical protein